MQGSAVLGNKFTAELILLRCYKIISNEVARHYDSENDCEEVSKYFYLTLYSAASLNYFKLKKTRKIIWSKKAGKVHGSEAGWRKANQEPPSTSKHKYAETLVKSVAENKMKLDKVNVLAQWEKHDNQPTVETNVEKEQRQHNVPHRRPPPYRPNGPKDVHKQVQRPRRQKNPHFDRNRGASSHDDDEIQRNNK